MNKVILIGRLTKDPDIKYVGENNLARASFSIAINRSFKNKDGNYDADFINCTAYGKVAETVEKYWHKGNMMACEGEWRTGSYEKDGKKFYTNECNVNRVEFVTSKAESKTDQGKSTNSAPKPSTATNTEDDFMEVPDGIADELPFFG